MYNAEPAPSHVNCRSALARDCVGSAPMMFQPDRNRYRRWRLRRVRRWSRLQIPLFPELPWRHAVGVAKAP
jgi:hypothetical protein